MKKDRHLEKSIGEEVELKTYKPIDKKKEFVGILKAFDKDTVTIEMEAEGKIRLFAEYIKYSEINIDTITF